MTTTHTLTVPWRDGTVTVTVTVTPPFAGRWGGPPDNWEPPEPGELDFEAIPAGVTDDDMPELEDLVWAALESEDYGPDPDEQYERWRDE
jgi:hypothetical protein